VCLGDRQLADSEETFDVCDKKCFGPTSLREPLIVNYHFHLCTIAVLTSSLIRVSCLLIIFTRLLILCYLLVLV